MTAFSLWREALWTALFLGWDRVFLELWRGSQCSAQSLIVEEPNPSQTLFDGFGMTRKWDLLSDPALLRHFGAAGSLFDTL
ncbi:hypothetical protein [Pajaroellobacter abortibovis]|nr:hypothetical protein [Pajaroellobacter abortibovis]